MAKLHSTISTSQNFNSVSVVTIPVGYHSDTVREYHSSEALYWSGLLNSASLGFLPSR